MQFFKSASTNECSATFRSNRAIQHGSDHARHERSSLCPKLFVLILLFAVATLASAQKFNLLDSEGSGSPLVQGTDGNLYGVSNSGTGSYGNGGSIFRMSPTGKLMTIYTFCSQPGCADGAEPNGLVLASDGNFYGTTHEGGSNSNIDCGGESAITCGTIFRITLSGKLTTLYNFCSQTNCADGSLPGSVLVQGTDGSLYGTTGYGGTGPDCDNGEFQPSGCGTVFKFTPSGVLTTLYSFCNGDFCPDGNQPWALVLGQDGNLYGTTNFGGVGFGGPECSSACGTVFKITNKGALTTLYSFCVATGCPDGAHPQTGLTQASNGDFYGVAVDGGADDFGTVFDITPSGTLITLYSFCAQSGCPDGAYPNAGPIQATDGNFYGTTDSHGANGVGGTLYKMTPAGTLTTIYSFCVDVDCDDGTSPSGFVQNTNGYLYGTAYSGGSTGQGTIFALTPGLRAFVRPVPFIGAIGSAVKILGTSLKGAIAVNFNGTAATFTVVSATQIIATVPAGATSGKITVVTAAGTLASNIAFEVK